MTELSNGPAPAQGVPGLNRRLAERLRSAGLDPVAVAGFVTAALAEDLAGGSDVTTAATVAAGAAGRGDLVARSAGVVAGLPVAAAVFALVAGNLDRGPAGAELACAELVADGDHVVSGQPVLRVTGPIGPILTAERTALNLLCHLSGVATLTRQWADAVAGTAA